MSKVEDAKKQIQNLGQMNEAASKHWNAAVKRNEIIKKLKGERDAARKLADKYRNALDTIAGDSFEDPKEILAFAADVLEEGESA